MRIFEWTPALIVGCMPLIANIAGAQAPFAVGGDPRVVPGDFQVTTFASGLDYPFGLAVLQDGSLMVAINPGPSFFSASAEILRFVDADDDGVADGPGSVLYASLPGPVAALQLAGDLVFVSVSVSSTTKSIYILRQGATPAATLILEGALDLTFPVPWQHAVFSQTARAAPGQPGKYELYFNVGSEANFAATSGTIPVSGLITGSVNPDSLYRVTVDDTGGSLALAGLLQIASGLRNAYGCAFDPITGDLYLQDNGIDGLVDEDEPLSADELNKITAADIGGAVEDFGFPSRYVEYRTGTLIGTGGIDPYLVYQPVPPPNGAESEGPVNLVFAPPLFPAGLREGLFVGFHGKFALGGLSNEENPVVYTDLGMKSHFHFIANTEPGIGHPNTLAATGDRLYMADMSASGGLSAPGTGSVFRIRYTHRSEVPALSVVGAVALAVLLIVMGSAMSVAGSRRPR